MRRSLLVTLCVGFACAPSSPPTAPPDLHSTPPVETVAEPAPAPASTSVPGYPSSPVTPEPTEASAPTQSEQPEPAVAVAVAQASEKAPPLPGPLYRKVDASCGKAKGIGTKLKGFSLKTPKGKTVSHRSYRNRVLLVNFWGTWCKPCLKELPEFDRLYRRYRKHGLTLVAIATDTDPKPVQAFVDKRKLRAKVLIGGEDYAGQYNAPQFPFTYVVDTKGTIVSAYDGYKTECMGKLEADIRSALEARNAK